jgi:hypothetical protein
LTTTTLAEVNFATSEVLGSYSCASTLVFVIIEVTSTLSPPRSLATEPHWLMLAITLIFESEEASEDDASFAD